MKRTETKVLTKPHIIEGEVIDKGCVIEIIREVSKKGSEAILKEMSKHDYEKFMYRGYIEALLFSEDDEDDTPLEMNYSLTDISKEAEMLIKKDIEQFMKLSEFIIPMLRFPADPETWLQMGTDFLLTRNHHGSGFWDRPEIYGEQASKNLTKIAGKFKNVKAYVQDDIVYI